VNPRLDGKAEKRKISIMKTTVDLPDPLFRKAKSTAAGRGISLKKFITEAVERTLANPVQPDDGKPWMRALESVPKVPKSVLDGVAKRVAEADAADLAKQRP